MSVVIKNVGAIARGPQNQLDTVKGNGRMAEQGTVGLVLRNIEYVWGPNDSKTLPNDIGAEAVAADSRLRIADTREGFDRGAART